MKERASKPKPTILNAKLAAKDAPKKPEQALPVETARKRKLMKYLLRASHSRNILAASDR